MFVYALRTLFLLYICARISPESITHPNLNVLQKLTEDVKLFHNLEMRAL